MMQFLERLIENTIFATRWVMAPFYLGLAAALVLLLIKFLQELFHTIPIVFAMTEAQLVLSILSLIDLSLAGNLLLLVIFSGYENFVSKIDNADHKDRPEWMGKIDYSGMKLKLVASIVAISAIQLLRAFMNLEEMDHTELAWLVGIHLTFVISGVLLAWMDRLTESAEGHGKDPHIPGDTEVRDGTVIGHGSKSGGGH
jgi:uncharacterized protein (TIGR00645 family)